MSKAPASVCKGLQSLSQHSIKHPSNQVSQHSNKRLIEVLKALDKVHREALKSSTIEVKTLGPLKHRMVGPREPRSPSPGHQSPGALTPDRLQGRCGAPVTPEPRSISGHSLGRFHDPSEWAAVSSDGGRQENQRFELYQI